MATYWENSCSFGLRYVSWYKCLIVSLVFSHLGFWSGNLFLIAPFPDLAYLCLFTRLYRGDHRIWMMLSQQRRIISVKYMVECKTGKQRLTNAPKLNTYNHHIHSRLPKQCETNTCPDIHLIIHAWSRVLV